MAENIKDMKRLCWLRLGVREPQDKNDDAGYAECMKRMRIVRGSLLSDTKPLKEYNLRNKYKMTEDDMTFMREVFMPDTQGNEKPKLPFAQYIVQWGLHPMMRGTLQEHEADQEPRGAMSDMRRKYGEHFQAVYKVPRPNGTQTKVSVISGGMFYSRKDEPYEVMVYDNNGKDGADPLPYQTDEQLMLLLAKLLGEDDGLSK